MKMKGTCLLLTGALLVMSGCAKDLKVLPTDNLTIEYGEKLDNSKLFNKNESDKGVKVSKVDGFNEKKVGEQEITVIFSDGNKDKEEKMKITVTDTKKPVIELKKESITITTGDKLDLKDIIKSVKDPVDGDLKYSDKAVEKNGYYFDKGKLDTKKAGTYEVKVIAVDVNGNKTEKSFKVNVKKKETAKKPSSNSSGNGNLSNNSSNNGGSNSGSSSNGGTSNNSGNSGSNSGSSSNGGSSNNSGNGGSTNKPVAPHHHSITVTGHPDVIYSNVFIPESELDSWADDYIWKKSQEDWAGASYSAEQCSCGLWSVYFFDVTYYE